MEDNSGILSSNSRKTNKSAWCLALGILPTIILIGEHGQTLTSPSEKRILSPKAEFHQGPEPSFPAGWLTHKAPEMDSQERWCAQIANDKIWEVSGHEEVIIKRWIPPTPSPWQLPFVPDLAAMLPDANDELRKRALRYILKTEAGWLVGLNCGEWGGGLWRFDETGRGSKIWDENVLGFVSVGGQPLALVGFAHGQTHSGKILQVLITSSQIDLKILADLDMMPKAWTIKEESLLVVTSKGLYQVTLSETRRVKELQLDFLGAASVVELSDGRIYIGMRLFILCLIPDGERYREQWLVPEDCQYFEIRDVHCVCMG